MIVIIMANINSFDHTQKVLAYGVDGEGNVAPLSTSGSGGSVSWGNIGGNLENQTDLKQELDSKAKSIIAVTGDEVATGNVIDDEPQYYKRIEVDIDSSQSFTSQEIPHGILGIDTTKVQVFVKAGSPPLTRGTRH
jgi:hypothetical protein